MLESAWDFFLNLLDPQFIINYGGITLLLIVVFIENGLFFGFFLPGDSLMFTTGLLISTGVLQYSLIAVILLVTCAALVGNVFGYLFGVKAGDALYTRKDSLFFKQKHLHMAKNYYHKYGGRTLIVSKFLPIIRTFAPIFGGLINMPFFKFVGYNAVGAISWTGSFITIGYLFGEYFPNSEKYLGYVILGLILITSIPVIVAISKSKPNQEPS